MSRGIKENISEKVLILTLPSILHPLNNKPHIHYCMLDLFLDA